MSQAGSCPSEIARRIARQTSRSVETIRYTLKQFDEKHPDLAVFPHRTGTLNEESKNKIYQSRAGVWPSACVWRSAMP